MWLRYCLSYSEMIPVAPVATGITFAFTFHMRRISVVRTSYFTIFSASFLTLRLLMSYIYGAPSKARNANVVYIWTYVWQR